MSLVTVFVSSPETYSERRLSPHLSVAELKTKLSTITGIGIGSQRLALRLPGASNGVLLSDDHRTLADYAVEEGSTVDVVDTDPASAARRGQYTDVSQVEKFELADEEYAKRNDSLLAYKQRNKLGRFADGMSDISQPDAPLAPEFQVGRRCQVAPLNDEAPASQHPRGVIQFAGEVSFGKGGHWVGVEYDEPIGKNDGSVQGERYFTARPRHGAFVKPDRVTVGDFPERDPFDDEMEM